MPLVKLDRESSCLSLATQIVGAFWVLGAWALVEPEDACTVASYLLLTTGTSRMQQVVAETLRSARTLLVLEAL